jgi:cellulose synthase/poly-beta-1,6-N-acetylglucosamine synthase-like glycosyltransferase
MQTRLLCLLSHVGTGFVRRALSTVNCLTIVSGNIGAFRRVALEQTGPFREGFIGEDLELTWRVHRAGFRVAFQPRAIVYAESPSTLLGLWKQRVRWARGLLQTAWLHHDMFFRPRYGPIAFYMPFSVVSMAFLPVVQILILTLLPILALAGTVPVRADLLGLISWLGLGIAALTMLFALTLDRAWRDLRFLYVLPLWVPCSIFMSVVACRALLLEIQRREAHWNKLERTGVVSHR